MTGLMKDLLETCSKTPKKIYESLEEHLQYASELQGEQYNKRHQPILYSVGQKVLSSIKNLNTQRPCKKLD